MGSGSGRRGINWDNQPLGRVADRELAKVLNVAPSTVQRARARRGIPSMPRATLRDPEPEPATLRSQRPEPGGEYETPVSPTIDPLPSKVASSFTEARPTPDVPQFENWISLRPYATKVQQEALNMLVVQGSVLEAAEALNVTPTHLRRVLQEVERAAARRGWSPAHDMVHDIPRGFHIKGVSTYYGDDGKPAGQWVKTASDKESRVAMLLNAIQEIAEPLYNQGGTTPPPPPPEPDQNDLMTVYPMGDPHIGLYAWAAESGEDFDLDIAERHLSGAMDHLVHLAPKSSTSLIVNLGDFFHADNSTNRTARGNNALDVDTRYGKVLAVGIRLMVRCIHRALQKHEHVLVWCLIGNHDDHSSLVLGHCLSAYFHAEPRVTIDTDPKMRRYHQFGKCMIAGTHGHTTKAAKLQGTIAAEMPEMWGSTKFRKCYCGHVHHETVKEYPGLTVETYRTLAARDAWHAGQGYVSGRDMRLEVWHRERGIINRHTVGVEQLG